ncbi:MAG: DNA recombination protein RmuC [Candidatus Heimdallarchaeota archaeon]
MAEVLMYVLISIACFLVLVSIFYQIFIQSRKKGETNAYTKQMQFAVDQTTREMQKFFDLLKMKPTTKGGFGENIVEILLSNLPNDSVKTQYQPPDISGRIDFVVRLPDSDLFIPIDSKFILPNGFEENEGLQLDKLAIDGLNKKAIRRAKEIVKYIDSHETTDFVLMYIPDFVYGVLSGRTYQELAKMGVVPTNTSGLLSTIFMINMQHRFIKLNSAASRFGDLQMKVNLGLREVIDQMRTGTSQLQHSMNNYNDAVNQLAKLNTMLETLNIDEFDSMR